jgi:hypothetical protein
MLQRESDNSFLSRNSTDVLERGSFDLPNHFEAKMSIKDLRWHIKGGAADTEDIAANCS